MDIYSRLLQKPQVCIHHKALVPYMKAKGILIMLVLAFMASLAIDVSGKAMRSMGFETVVIMTPYIFYVVILLWSNMIRNDFNADVYVTRKGVTFPDFHHKSEVFVEFKDIKAIYIYYFPITPLLWFGPYITTHFAIEPPDGEKIGVHSANVNDYRSIMLYLQKYHNVPVKHRLCRLPLFYLALPPLGLALALI